MKTVYLVRHGQTEANASPVFQGDDSPLTDKGKQQAQQLADRVSNLDFELLVSSPLKRAHQTAEIISKATKKEIEFSDLLVEKNKPTNIKGKPYTDEAADTLWRKWEESTHTIGTKIEDGENYEELVKRAHDALNFLQNKEEENIVVVTHGHFLRCLVMQAITDGNPTPELYKSFHKNCDIQNTGITILKFKDGFEQDHAWRLYAYNDIAHLAE